MSDARIVRLQGITTGLIVLCLSAASLVVGARISQVTSAGAAVTTIGQAVTDPMAAEATTSKLTTEDYLMLADETCAAFDADSFKIMPTKISDLAGYLGGLSARARQLHDALMQIELPEGDTRELVIVLDQIERSATGLSQAVEATAKTGEVAVEMAFEPSYAQALLGDLNAGIHAWRAGLRACGPRPLETSEMDDIGEPLNSKVR